MAAARQVLLSLGSMSSPPQRPQNKHGLVVVVIVLLLFHSTTTTNTTVATIRYHYCNGSCDSYRANTHAREIRCDAASEGNKNSKQQRHDKCDFRI